MPRTLGKYELMERVALGGMAEIFLAKQEGPAGFEKELAVKCILPQHAQDASFVRMFLDEARLAARLSHPNIVQIYDLGEQEGTYYIAMEYVRGISLSDAVDRAHLLGVDMPYHYAARMMADVLSGLDYAHEFSDAQGSPLGLVHRDMSPDNVLVSYNGAVKTIDFGVAKTLDNEVKTDSGVVKGKYLYMSPEQVMGASLDGRSDIFSASIVLYEMVTGKRPFGANAGLMAVSAIVNDPPVPPREHSPDIPPELERIILRGLEKDPGNRFRKAREMQRELETFIHAHARYVGDSDIGELVRRLVRGQEQDVRWIEARHAEVENAGHRRARPHTVEEPVVPGGFSPTVAAPMQAPATLKDAGKLGGVGVASGHLAHMVTAKPNAALLARAARFRKRRSRRRGVYLLGALAILLGAAAALLYLSGQDSLDRAAPPPAPLAQEEPAAGEAQPHVEAAVDTAGTDEAPPPGDEGEPAKPETVVHEIDLALHHGATAMVVGEEPDAQAAPAAALDVSVATDDDVAAGEQVDADAASRGGAEEQAEVGPKEAEPPKPPPKPRFTPGQMRGTGKLIVDSAVPGTVVYLNGKRSGGTPFRENLVEGTYAVELRAGPATWKRSVAIAYDGTVTLKAPFKAGGLQVRGVPSGVVCSLDGKQLMRSAFEDKTLTVAAGGHVIECDNPAHGRKTFKVAVDGRRPTVFDYGAQLP